MLPKISINNKFEYKIHHLDKTINAQGYTVGQESTLLTAIQTSDIYSKDNKKATNAIKKIQHAITNLCQECILTEGIEVKNWPNYELEFFFLTLRINSTGDIINSQFMCDGTITDNESGNEKECKNVINLDLDLNEFYIKEYSEYKNIFELAKGYKLFLKPILPLQLTPESGDKSIIKSCLDYMVYEDGDEITEYKFSEIDKGEIDAFVNDSISPKVMNDILKYFFNMSPTIYHKTSVICSECNKTHVIETKTTASLFQ